MTDIFYDVFCNLTREDVVQFSVVCFIFVISSVIDLLEVRRLRVDLKALDIRLSSLEDK